MKAVKYIILFMLLIQFFLPSTFSVADVYHNRMDYELVKSNLHDIDAVLQQMKREIKTHNLKDYVIVLGDSVLYGSPGDSNQVFNAFLQQYPDAPGIYNLSLPAMQLGDLYVMLLKLKEYGISTDRLIFNMRYASFIERDPFPAAVFWLKEELHRLDPASYKHILDHLISTGYNPPNTLYERYSYYLHEVLIPKISLFRYQDTIKVKIKHKWLALRGKPIPSDALGDPRPWSDKDFTDFMGDEALIKSFSDKPFDLTENNPDIYFLNKIIAMQKGKQTLALLTGTNHEMMKEYVHKPQYVDNLTALDKYMSDQPVKYVNLEGRISNALFTDHTHFTPEGYEQLSEIIWNELE
ncbi:MAG: hypothetical protein K0R67_1117 [Paenibacillus sp.]|jgi:hypothetical protein|nr:hypothetical protein [Paenibacillus sp.]